jgi:hypothetical protein
MDPRFVCGTDVRRTAWSPEDATRAEGFVARYGGTLSVVPVGDAAVSVSWKAGELSVTASGATATEALRDLAHRMAQ